MDHLETLRQVNASLRSALIRLHPEQKHCSAIRPEDFAALLSEMLRARESLKQLKRDSESAGAVENESLEYRSNLEKLQYFLPDLHGRLIAERARIETARQHVAAAVAWAGTSNKTL